MTWNIQNVETDYCKQPKSYYLGQVCSRPLVS